MGYSSNSLGNASRPRFTPAPYQTGEVLAQEQPDLRPNWDYGQAHEPKETERVAAPAFPSLENGPVVMAESPDRIRALAAMGIGGLPTAGAYEGRIVATVENANKVHGGPSAADVARVIHEAELLTVAELAQTLPSALGERALVGGNA